MTSSLLRVVVDDFDVPHLLYLLALPLRAGTSLSSQESCTRRLFLCQHASTRARSRGSLARPYMLLLISLSRFTCPSRGPWPPSAARVLQAPPPCRGSDPSGKRLELWQTAYFCRAEPGIQLVSGPLSDHLHERLCQAVSGLCTGAGLSDQRQFLLLGLVQLLWLTHKQPGGTLCREVFQWCGRSQDPLTPLSFRRGRRP